MKNILKRSALLALLVITFYSCTEESEFRNPVHFALDNGAFARFTQATPATALLNDFVTNGYFTDQLIDANNNMTRYSLTMTATIGGTTTTVEDFIVEESFPADFSITADAVAAALGIPVTDINFGDSFAFVATATRNDGVEFNGNSPVYDSGEVNIDGDETLSGGNTDATLNNPATGYFSAMNFGFIVACNAFTPDAVAGTYDVTQGSFFAFLGETSFVRTVLAGPSDIQVTIVGGEYVSTGADDLIVDITANGIVVDYNEDGVAIPAGTAGLPENLYFDIQGIILPCIDNISLKVNFNPFSANEHDFILQRQ